MNVCTICRHDLAAHRGWPCYLLPLQVSNILGITTAAISGRQKRGTVETEEVGGYPMIVTASVHDLPHREQ